LKKFLVIASFLGLASVSQAAFIQCTPNSGDFVNSSATTSTTFTCNPSAAAGNITGDGLNVTAIQLVISVSAQVTGGTAQQVYSVGETVTNNAGLNNPGSIVISCTANGLGSCTAGPSDNSGSPATTSVGPVDQFGTFTVTVAGLAGANPLPNNGTAAVYYMAVTAPINTGTPEPSTFAMLGLALSAAGIYARRRKA
jgi:hypothetical protein